ncbi:MAG: GNAT family N-acetyltransferase [Acidimicrobiia bacterium]|nr:GNAT family N-acetyltransferase [Acidimicrobiia bacterium]
MNGYVGPELLAPDHVLDGFDCANVDLNKWLVTRSRHNQREGASRTWVVSDQDRVVAFYASSTAVILRAAATKRAARNMPDPVPSVLLARLAVDLQHQGRRLGDALLKHFIIKAWEVAQITGVRVLLAHAADESAAQFYLHHEFERSPLDDLTMTLLVKDIAR